MIPMMKTMTGVTQRLADKMAEVGGLMDAMSTHMPRSADAMNNGVASEMEIHFIQGN